MLTRNKELVKAIKENRLFDYIGNNGYDFSRQELIDIIKEMDAICDCILGDEDQESFNNKLLDNLFDYTYIFDRNDDDISENEKVYKRYQLGIDTYEDYLAVCEIDEVVPLPEIED